MSVAERPSVDLSIPPDNTLSTIENIVDQCGLMSSDGASHFLRSVRMAAGIKALRQILTDDFMKEFVMPLQGCKLGFKTDKDKVQTDKDGGKGYQVAVVRDCAIENLLRGGRLTGNEFNIIAGNCYSTKEFFERVVAELPGLTDLRTRPGVPQTASGGALVPYIAVWKMNGVEQSIECLQTKLADGAILDERIPVKVNEGMGADAILGKAKRKMLARVYNQITGSNAWDGDAEDAPAGLPAPSSMALLTEKLNKSNGTAAPAETAAQETKAAETSTDADDLLVLLGAKIDQAIESGKDVITKIGQAEAWAKQGTLTDEVSLQITEMCAKAKAEVRSKRGSGSNKSTEGYQP